MIWSTPHVSKIYEALGAIGDNRIEFIDGVNEARMYSSSLNKYYTVIWNDDLTQMMSNDNSAYFVGQLSYPMISVLLLKGKIMYKEELTEILKGIKWKDINKKFKNNFDKTINFVLKDLEARGEDIESIKEKIQNIAGQLPKLKIESFGKRLRPPKGY